MFLAWNNLLTRGAQFWSISSWPPQAPPHLLTLQVVPGASFIFPALTQESIVSPRSPGFFHYRMTFTNQDLGPAGAVCYQAPLASRLIVVIFSMLRDFKDFILTLRRISNTVSDTYTYISDLLPTHLLPSYFLFTSETVFAFSSSSLCLLSLCWHISSFTACSLSSWWGSNLVIRRKIICLNEFSHRKMRGEWPILVYGNGWFSEFYVQRVIHWALENTSTWTPCSRLNGNLGELGEGFDTHNSIT